MAKENLSGLDHFFLGTMPFRVVLEDVSQIAIAYSTMESHGSVRTPARKQGQQVRPGTA